MGTDTHLVALGLQNLDVSCNDLRRLPAELSSLVNLEGLAVRANGLGRAPVTVLSMLTALKTIDLRNTAGGQAQELLEEIQCSRLNHVCYTCCTRDWSCWIYGNTG
jgi:hypothetical protein